MSFLNIETVRREGAKVVIALVGVSGGGKTFTAIQLGYGLVNYKAEKLGFLDTENRRGRLYADALPKPFKIADFPAPFSPSRYIDAIRQFERAGVEVLIVDSATHEWEGIGGCEDIATEGVLPGKPGRWNKAKSEHKKFMNALLQSSMHIIVCVRAREKTKMDKDAQGKTIFIPQGIQPVQEKNFMFEMTASIMMQEQGRRQDVLKCPAALQDILGRGEGYITAKDGEALRAWIDGATPVNRSLESERAKLAEVCEGGLKALEQAWQALPPALKKKLEGDKEGFKASAKAYDDQRKIEAEGDRDEETQNVAAALMRTEPEVQPSPKPPAKPPQSAPVATPNQQQAHAPQQGSNDDDGDIFPSAGPANAAGSRATVEG